MKSSPKHFFPGGPRSWHWRDSLSRRGEREACRYLKKRGYRILQKRFRTRFGEIDVVAQRGRTVCFVEVKTRRGSTGKDPLEAVTFSKWQRIQRAAMAFMQRYFRHRHDLFYEFLAIGIRWNATGPHLNVVTLYFD